MGDGRLRGLGSCKPSWNLLGSVVSILMGADAYARPIAPEQHVVGTQHTQTIKSKHIKWRTRSKQLVRRTMCFSKTTTRHDLVIGLFINRDEFGRCL